MNLLLDTRHEGALAERGEGAFDGSHDSSTASAPEAARTPDFSPRNLGAMDWQLGRPVSSIDRSAPASDSSTPAVDATGTVDRITNLVVREAALVRHYKSDAMAVVLRPDAETELYVHFTQRNGQIEATVRCERGDAQQLSALWPQLQESLGQQKVRLAPLQESPSSSSGNSNSNFNPAHGSPTGGGHQQSPRQTPDRQSMDEWPVPASSPETRDVRGRGASGHRRLTTSRPGWETWA